MSFNALILGCCYPPLHPWLIVTGCVLLHYYSSPHTPTAVCVQWWEVDLGYYFICLLGALGLAWDIKVPTEADKARKRKPVVIDATGKLE